MYHEDIKSDVRDESVLVYWFLPFSFWCLYPHLLNKRTKQAEALSGEIRLKNQRIDDERDGLMQMRSDEME